MPKALISWNTLKTRVPYGRARVDQLEAAGKFPRRRKIGEGKFGRVAWLEAEVDQWISKQPLHPMGDPAKREAEPAKPDDPS